MDSFLYPSGYCILTYRFVLKCSHPQWLKETQKLYHQVQDFYLEILKKHRELYGLGSQPMLRELEKLTVCSKNNPAPAYPLPWKKLPAYFRRAAVNAVIAALKSRLSKEDPQTPSEIELSKVQSSVTFYQRMYKDLCFDKISLRVWNGEQWKWLECQFYGNHFPEGKELLFLSPKILINYKNIFLDIPVKQSVSDGRKLKQRMQEKENVCALQFANTDTFAAASILDGEGNQLVARFFKGGREYVHRCRKILERIEKSQKSGGSQGQAKADQRHWMALKHLKEYQAHKISREVIAFCKAYEVKVLTWEEYKPEYTRNVMQKAGSWSALHLSSRIKAYLNYKAWSEGILIAPVKTYQIKDRALGPGNETLQRARKIGRQCLKNF